MSESEEKLVKTEIHYAYCDYNYRNDTATGYTLDIEDMENMENIDFRNFIHKNNL